MHDEALPEAARWTQPHVNAGVRKPCTLSEHIDGNEESYSVHEVLCPDDARAWTMRRRR